MVSKTITEEMNEETENTVINKKIVTPFMYRNLISFGYWHMAAFYGLYLCFTSAKYQTIVFELLLYIAGEIGITAGAHRLWSHKAYKAKLPLQIILMIFNSIAFQNTATDWVRDHRLHHKYSDTDADPYNSRRGLVFSHIGWLFFKKHPEVSLKGKGIDMSDIYNNPVLKFQRKYAIPLIGSVCFILPTIIPIYLWNETLNNAWHLVMLRFMMNLHATSLINSVAHRWGYKPYDKDIYPTDNLIITSIVLGEGFHNYHHAFPRDYRTGEIKNNYLNLTTKFIDLFAAIGWAYDLKTTSEQLIRDRMKRTGDLMEFNADGDYINVNGDNKNK